jgi:nucleoid-associated protein YgaU
MRILGCVLLAVFVGVAACGDDPATAPTGDGALVLEVGGGQPSLRQALERAGLPVPPRVDLATPVAAPSAPDGESVPAGDASAARQQDGASPPAQSQPQPQPQPQPLPQPPPASAADTAHVVVTLAEGQTLIHLARKHLGDGNRFREILALNGWTESESRRLKPGTKVKVPKAGAIRGGGR